MRKHLIAGLFALCASSAFAHGPVGYYGGYHHSGGNWVAPLIIGGIAGAVIANSRQVYQQPPVVYYPPVSQPQPQVVYPNQPVYKMVEVYIPECNCYRSIQVQIN